MNKEPSVIFDIDGTLSCMEYRRHLITGENKKWDEFYKLSINDVANPITLPLLNMLLNKGIRVFYCTGKSEKYRKITEEWLFKNGIYTHNSSLNMRKRGDERSNPEVKREMLKEIRENFDVVLAVENNKEVEKMLSQEGILCCICGDIVEKEI